MHVIKLDATASTNLYLKQMLQRETLKDFTVVRCDHQTNGKGQQGNQWVSEKGKNLTVSVLKHLEGFKVSQVYYLNCLVSMAIYEALTEMAVPKVKVKWPNDIMSGNKKICGILIENVLRGPSIKSAILGFGLNVNQVSFPALPSASSLKLETGKNYDLEGLLQLILGKIEDYFGIFQNQQFSRIKRDYESVLFRKGEMSDFLLPNGTEFKGYIQGITNDGQLLLKRFDNEIVAFNFKEVKLLY